MHVQYGFSIIQFWRNIVRLPNCGRAKCSQTYDANNNISNGLSSFTVNSHKNNIVLLKVKYNGTSEVFLEIFFQHPLEPLFFSFIGKCRPRKRIQAVIHTM